VNIGFNHYHVDIFAQSFATTGGFATTGAQSTITDFYVLDVCKT